jgi:predicted nucleic acid-binding protein
VTSDEAPQEFRVVLDTNVAVSGLLSRQGAAHALIDLALRHRKSLRLGASEANCDELLATLRAPRLASRIIAGGVRSEALAMFYTMLTYSPVPTTLWRGQ